MRRAARGFTLLELLVAISILAMVSVLIYGAFAAKVLIVRAKGLPGVALPLAGGALFAMLVLVWYSSALWFVQEQGWPAI